MADDFARIRQLRELCTQAEQLREKADALCRSLMEQMKRSRAADQTTLSAKPLRHPRKRT
jgi:hypothetical protein